MMLNLNENEGTGVMKTVWLNYGIVLGLFLHTSFARASGCMWYDEYELRTKIDTVSVKGKFDCISFGGDWYGCRFFSSSPHQAKFVSLYLRPTELPPQKKEVEYSVDAFEAMHWQNCDGSDPVPEYEQNGIYHTFRDKTREYVWFELLKD